MTNRLILTGGFAVLPSSTVKADLILESGRITDIITDRTIQPGADDRVLDVTGAWILPGLIDIHCDTIEKEIEPRPNTLFPLEMAFLQFERKLAGHGITTMLHSLSLGVGLSIRGEHLVSEVIELIRKYRGTGAMIRHGVHLRYEISHLTGIPLAEQLISEGAIDYFSLMDHAPGQGQYRREGAFERYVMKNQGVDLEEVSRIVKELQERRSQIDWDKLMALTGQARVRGIPVASHDDDSKEAVERSKAFGAAVSEFPLELEAAAYARSLGMGVCVGAPNIVRGGSHDGNMSAEEAVKKGAADLLCSDYHPASLLHAIFLLEQRGIPLAGAAALATINPARMLGRENEIGSVEIGKKADLIVVRKHHHIPLVQHTIVDGIPIYSVHTP